METASAIAHQATTTIARVMPSIAPRALRLSLVHQIVLLLVAAVLLAVTVLGGVVAWNLRTGFTDYLRAQDEDWLDRFTAVASAAVAQRGLAAIAGPPGTLRLLFEAVAPSDGAAPRPPMQPRPAGESARGDDADDEPRPDRPPRRGPPGPPGGPPPGAQRIASRLSVVDLQGRPLSGRPLPAQDLAAERTVVVDGLAVARVRLARGELATHDVDAAFLARQYRGILLTALALLLLAVAGAVAVGRRWLRPVQEAQHAARRIAKGALDVRLQPRGNDELTDLAHDINAMATALQALEASRRRWIAELSHEMRTPLAVLRAEVECLIDGLRPLDHVALSSLQDEVARLTRLVEDFHELALSDLHALPCTFAPLQPRQLLQDAVARVAARAQAAGIQLECVAQGAPAGASWDRQRIEQLLANRLENSLRYTDAPGRLRLSIAAAATGTGAGAGAGQVAITLDDSAPGVAAAELPRLFDPLYRADPSRSRRSGGSGLGLAICRAIVRSHGGHIEAGASPLGGLRVVATLPLQPPGAP